MTIEKKLSPKYKKILDSIYDSYQKSADTTMKAVHSAFNLGVDYGRAIEKESMAIEKENGKKKSKTK